MPDQAPASQPPPGHVPSLWPWWLGWLVFVVYGSLVPLDFRPLPPDLAWQQLLNAPLLNIGAAGRADWIANGVLYLPVGFFSTVLLLGRRPQASGVARRIAAALLVLCFGAALAVAVELAQTAFPPRTVSRNDLIAEGIGTALGVIVALADAGRFRRLLSSLGTGGPLLVRRLALSYALIYPALALFPFDLLLSAEEWREKLASDLVGTGFAGSALALGGPRLAAKLAVEAIAVAPLGALWMHTRGGRRSWLAAALLGALLGAVIECAQLALASGQSQGASVLTRAAGFALGAGLWQARSRWPLEALRATLRRFSAALVTVNLLLLGVLNGAWRPPWLSVDQALQRLGADTRFVPFYYHYYTSEMQAVVSLIAVGLSYAPLGLLGWAWGSGRGAVVLLTALLAGLLEAAKLFSEGTHPDPTNVAIAAVAAWAAQTLLQRLATTR